MTKQATKYDWISTSRIITLSFFMIIFSLLVTWGVELLMKELFRLR
ncbi:MAG: hypothetical protein QX196_01815 [Methylococcaceae bacterium]|jgi:hypothetical protein